MSADNQSSDIAALSPPYVVCLPSALSAAEQETISSLLRLLPADYIDEINLAEPHLQGNNTAASEKGNAHRVTIKKMVDGRGLACPMPLLKTKVALRDVTSGEALYVVATDPNSQADITAFCQQTQAGQKEQLLLLVNQMSNQKAASDEAVSHSQETVNDDNNESTASSADTIFHFIITKTGSN